MGMDFVGVFVPLEVPKDEALSRLRGMHPADVAQILEECNGWLPDSDAEIMQYAERAVETAYNADRRRDCCWFRYRGATIVFTGGDTWGDTPTSAFDYLNVAACLAVTFEPEGVTA